MGWQIALILDSETDPGDWIGQMPVWAIGTPIRSDSAAKLRADWTSLWEPEPALTLLNPPAPDNAPEALLSLIPTLEEHHPVMSCVRILGLPDSEPVRQAMASIGYIRIEEDTRTSVGFAKPVGEVSELRELVLNAESWRTSDDVFDSFFQAVGAPSWHGRNFSALNDSIATGNINKTEVPYRIVIRNANRIGTGAAELVGHFEDLIREIHAKGCPVEMRLDR
jgi:hypothetical protein